MKKEMRRAAARMLARAQQLGLKTKDGLPLAAVDLMEELLAAKEGYRNAHAYRAALEKRETPALEQENPDEGGNDYRLVEGRGVWVSMGLFVVHPYFTDEGIVVDVYGKGAESEESIASCYAFESDAEDAIEASKGGRNHLGLSDENSHRLIRKALEDLGYEIKPDVDQPSLWVWTAPTDACQVSLGSEGAAVAAAWQDVSNQAKAVHQLSQQSWSELTVEKQVALVLSLGAE